MMDSWEQGHRIHSYILNFGVTNGKGSPSPAGVSLEFGNEVTIKEF